MKGDVRALFPLGLQVMHHVLAIVVGKMHPNFGHVFRHPGKTLALFAPF